MGDGPTAKVAAADDKSIDMTRAAGTAALGIFLLLTISGRGQDLLPSPARMALVLAWPAALLLYALSNRVSVVVGYCIAGGFVLRWVDFFPGGGSDVLPATAEAIATTLAGGNPYAHWYASERPPSDNFPYPPIEMLIHLPGYLVAGLTGVRFTEVIAALLVMVAFVWLARRVSITAALPALALYAALPNLVNLSVDAGNDTSTGAMLLLAVLAAAWAAERGFIRTRWSRPASWRGSRPGRSRPYCSRSYSWPRSSGIAPGDVRQRGTSRRPFSSSVCQLCRSW